MKSIVLLRVLAVACAVGALASCGGGKGEATPTEAAAPVRVEPAAAVRRQQTLSAFGTVEISSDHSRTISLPYDSVVVVLRAAAGETVRVGAPIIEVRPTPAAAVEQRRAAEALRFARGDSERVKRLRAQNLATNADLAAVTQALANAQSTVAELGAPSGAHGAQVVAAPIAGLIVTLGAAPGVVIPAGAPIAVVGDAQRLQARLGVEIEELANIRESSSVTLSDLQQRRSARGSVSRILRRIDPTTRLAEVTVTLPAGAGFLPGAAVRAEIAIGAMRDVISIRKAALVYAGDTPSLFVAQGGLARKKTVKVGAEFDDHVEVLSGLEIGAAVIVDGAATLEDGGRVALPAAAKP